MTLDQAGAKGLIKPLGQTKEDTQQQFENQIKSANLSLARYNATKPNSQVVDTGAGKSLVTYDDRGNIISQKPLSASQGNTVEQLSQTQSNIDQVSGLLNNKNLKTAVGPNIFTRITGGFRSLFTPDQSDFVAGVQQLTSQLTLDSLIRAKAQGATFGALSEGELNILAGSASKLNTWAIKDGKGNVKGYNTTEKSFRAELDKINNFAKLDYVLKGGDPNSVGVVVHPDGTAWSKNSDGSVTQIYP
jgi:hypothetical protein